MFKLKRPCKNCPFRSDIPFYLTRERAAEIANALREGEFFPCHKTVKYGEDEEGECTANVSNSQMCAGASIVLIKDTGSIYTNNAARVVARIERRDISVDLDMHSPVYDNLMAFEEAMDP